MKKLLALLTAMLLAVACLSGCGGVDTSKKKSQADSDDVTITVWCADGGGQAVLEKIMDEWNSTVGAEKNIYINWKTVMDYTQMDVAEQGGQLPEITDLTDNQVRHFALNGSLAAIEEFSGGKEFLEEYNQPDVENYNFFNGKRYTVHRKALMCLHF